ncbi:MAG: hypothetical protein II304_04345 [Bacteroidales bacterium]|nr:hypothetical protein [Bacteroidales bacterium]
MAKKEQVITREYLMGCTIDEVVTLCVNQYNQIQELKKDECSSIVKENNKKLRKENTKLKKTINDYKNFIKKGSEIGIIKEEKKEEQPQK